MLPPTIPAACCCNSHNTWKPQTPRDCSHPQVYWLLPEENNSFSFSSAIHILHNCLFLEDFVLLSYERGLLGNVAIEF